MEYRYLIYSIDKHQSSPTLANKFDDDLLNADVEFCSEVVVDLQERKRLFYGEWERVYVTPKPSSLPSSDKPHQHHITDEADA